MHVCVFPHGFKSQNKSEIDWFFRFLEGVDWSWRCLDRFVEGV